MTQPILIAGPTASGKSGLATALAERLGGVVINADSQQVYRDWRILTARPGPEDEARVPHRLYGHTALDADYSVGTWLGELAAVLAECRDQGQRAIIAGGTGLYFKALTEGLAPIPPVPEEIRTAAEQMLERLGPAGLAEELDQLDPETMAGLDRANPVRLMRAWEVLEASGKGLAAWHRETEPPLLALADTVPMALMPPRPVLRERILARLWQMVEEGVVDEVARVNAQVDALGIDLKRPSMKPVGAHEFRQHLAGECTLDEAVASAKVFSCRYAKRQMTWIRNQMFRWEMLESHNPAENLARATDIVAKAA